MMFSVNDKAGAAKLQSTIYGLNAFMDHESEVNVERIMKKIRDDVARRKQGRIASSLAVELLAPEEHDTPVISQQSIIPAWIKKSRLWRALKEFNALLKRIELYQRWYSRLYSGLERMVVPRDGIYNIEDFLKYQDREFIISAYTVLMGSEPPRAQTTEMLTALKNGSLGRIDILWRLWTSPQGKMKNTRIKGLTRRYVKWKILKIQI